MDSTGVKWKPNPREKANIVSVLAWLWTIDIFKTGYTTDLATETLYEPKKQDESSLLGDRLEKQWKIEIEKSQKRGRTPSLLKAVWRTFIREYVLMALIQFINEFIIRLCIPLLLGGLLHYFRRGFTGSFETTLWYAIGICLLTALNTITTSHFICYAMNLGLKIRVAVCSVLYRKVLQLNKTAIGESAQGKVINLMSNDVSRFELVTYTLNFMWSAPLFSVIVAYILYQKVGYPGLIGMIIVFLIVPFQSYTGKLTSKFRLQTAIRTDERVRLMDEIISGVQVIKMYAWEKPFCSMIELARKLELQVVIKNSYIRGIYMTFNLFTTRMALYCTLVAILLFGQKLSAEEVFVVTTYFNALSYVMSSMFVRGVAEGIECLVTMRRLQNFLLNEEFQKSNVVNIKLPLNRFNSNINNESELAFKEGSGHDLSFIDDDVNNLEVLDENNERTENRSIVIATDSADPVENNSVSGNWAVKMTDVTVKWDLNHLENTLQSLNLEVEKGKLYVLIGIVGSGKSSFLSAILGEINLTEGKVKVNGNISYASQEAWVFSSSVRQNILFGQTYDRQRYQKVVKACALQKDFKQFPQGDQTIVGERGSSLSGGQKARINLARALYRQADIYLLDDPLSAVDTQVCKHLYRECVEKYLAKKTRVLVTHQLQYVKQADAVILVEQGKIKYFSHYRDLLNYRPEYNVLLAGEDELSNESSIESNMIKRQYSSSCNKSSTSEISDIDDEEEDGNNEEQTLGLEKTSRGAVKGSIFVKYFKTGTNIYRVFITLFLFILTQMLVSLNDYFIPILLKADEMQHYSNESRDFNGMNASVNATSSNADLLPVNVYIYIYTGIVLSIFCVGITRSLFMYDMCKRCSQRLHDMMFSALIRTKMRFFDINPSGRILNRFSKDVGIIDELVPKGILDASQVNLIMIGSLIVICTVNPIFLAPIILIGIVMYWLKRIYIRSSKNIKRLEGMSRSPYYTHVNTTLNGLMTVRAYGAQSILKTEFDKLQDMNTSAFYLYITMNAAFTFCLDILCTILMIVVIFSCLLLRDEFSSGEVGLAITQIMMVTMYLQIIARQNAEIENQMMAVERVIEYIQLPPEPNLRDNEIFLKKKDKQNLVSLVDIPKNWPCEGCIQFKNVNMRYAEKHPLVLKGLNFVIYPGQKVGIVGRTGAGKSSLISALFRLAKIEGIIEIDNVDTGSIALEDLRRKISIIPQDPVLFSGSLRRNLDPFDEFSDKDLWEALEEVELKDAIVNVGNGLESRVFGKGNNYSVGQRQLVCLARAILRNNRILMLDEATANVDPQTDALIQRTIRKKFATCTMLTVAHRLNTIIDSDKVLVMDKGHMVEYDHPYILLQNRCNQFTSLVNETNMYDQLFKLARQSYVVKYKET